MAIQSQQPPLDKCGMLHTANGLKLANQLGNDDGGADGQGAEGAKGASATSDLWRVTKSGHVPYGLLS